MTDKQIIDGVDVSGCNYGEIEKSIFKCSCEYNVCSASMFCKENPNCYYKQLKRKEQECETQQKALELQKSFLDHSEWKLKRAKQKLEKIKNYCVEQNLKADWTACEILKIIEE